MTSHLFKWNRHRGVQSLTLDASYTSDSHIEFSNTIVQLFPSVKKFDLTIFLVGDNLAHEINQMMAPFEMWDLDEVHVVAKGATESSLLVEVLKNIANWTGNN